MSRRTFVRRASHTFPSLDLISETVAVYIAQQLEPNHDVSSSTVDLLSRRAAVNISFKLCGALRSTMYGKGS